MNRTDDEILEIMEPHMREFAQMTSKEAAKQFTPYNIAPRWVELVFGEIHPKLRQLAYDAGGNEATFEKIKTRLGEMFAEEYERLVPRPKTQ